MLRAKSPRTSNLLTLVAIVLVIAVLYFAREILIPLALAILLTFLFMPVVTQFEKLRLGRILSVLMVLVLAFALFVAACWGLSGQVAAIIDELPAYTTSIENKIQSVQGSGGNALTRAISAVEGLENAITGRKAQPSAETGQRERSHAGTEQGAPTAATPIPVRVEGSSGLSYVRALLGPTASVLARVLIVIVFTLFMLAKREDLRNRILRLAGKGQLSVMTRALDDASSRISRYLFLQLLVNSSYGVLFGVGLHLLGVPHAPLWGFLSGVLRFVPYFGTLIAACFPIATAFAVFPGWHHALFVLLLYLVIELAVAYVMEPWLYGVHTGISPFAILVAAIFWAMLWGPVGLILSVPLTVCLMVVGRNIPQLRFIEILLGDEPVLAAETEFYQRLLAMDLEEARDISQEYLKHQPLARLYEGVFIPALSMAERDRRNGDLDEEQKEFICQSTRDLIEEFGERLHPPALTIEDGGLRSGRAAPGGSSPRTRVICVPARDEIDELIAQMLAQLLERAGFEARSISVGSIGGLVENVAHHGARIACLSALPPFALSQARSLCRGLRTHIPEMKIILGLWRYEGGGIKAEGRIGSDCADQVVTTLSEAVEQAQRTDVALRAAAGLPEQRLKLH